MAVDVQITPEMIERCYEFASEIILGDNQYDRLPNTVDKRIERTFVGKLSELVFYNYICSRGINYDIGDMFEIYDGQENVDGYDFITRNGITIDIKSASRTDHYMIMVPIDQFENIPKDYYVGVKINTGVTRNQDIQINDITTATIYGYCDYNYLANRYTKSYGEGPCKAAQLERLLDIEDIVRMF
ncbi:MAG: hypothetical protein ACLR2K_04635 [Paraclostridium sordellii]